MNFKMYVENASPDCLRLLPEGFLGNGDATAYLHSATMNELLKMRKQLVMDLSCLSGYDAAGLAGLKAVCRHAAAVGAELLLVNVPPQFDMVFHMTVVFLQAEPMDFAYRA